MKKIQTTSASITVTRQQLYEMVWSAPAYHAAKQLEISSRYLTTLCRWLDVPAPPRGYWRRLTTGGRPPQPPLPADSPGSPKVWSKGNRSPQPLPQRISVYPRPQPIAAPHRKTHKMIREATQHFRNASSATDGYLRPEKKLLPDILMSRKSVDRALAFASLLYNELEARGYRMTIAEGFELLIRAQIHPEELSGPWHGKRVPWSPLRPTVAYVHGVPIGLTLEEILKSVQVRYVGDNRYVPETEYHADKHVGHTWKTEKNMPTGKLRLVAYSPFYDLPWMQRWEEREIAQLDSEIDRVILSLESGALDLSLRLERAGRYFGD
ncbi:hypothetical protein [Rhizobium sp. HT1-10]|uniref:hypothetical protein n=1 Tax=Rhizobium sp. HT1-10 TaxID=3111638 RepID=UPI003C1690D3